jgi:hypothetical protein
MTQIASWGRACCGMLAFVSACAGSKQSAAPAQATTMAAAPAPPPSARPSAGAASDRAAPVEVESPSQETSSSGEFTSRRVEAGDPHRAGSQARVRLAEARHELEIAASERDCARACRALQSMERAAQQICELARSGDERTECASAGEQVDKARTKVQSACGGCPAKPR